MDLCPKTCLEPRVRKGRMVTQSRRMLRDRLQSLLGDIQGAMHHQPRRSGVPQLCRPRTQRVRGPLVRRDDSPAQSEDTAVSTPNRGSHRTRRGERPRAQAAGRARAPGRMSL